MNFSIDERIRSHIPPLRQDELRQLEENILAEGCRYPLVIWNGLLLDGHNRFDICSRHDIRFETEEIELPDLDAAIDWIEDNQLGRRNLTADQFAYFIGRKYERTKRREGRPSGEEKLDQNDPVSTAEKIAAHHPRLALPHRQRFEGSAQPPHLRYVDGVRNSGRYSCDFGYAGF